MADVHRSVLESTRAEQARIAEEARLEAEREARIEAAAAEQAEAKKLRAEQPPGTADLLAKRAPRTNGSAPRSRAHVAAERAAQERIGSVAAAAVAAERAKVSPATDARPATDERASTADRDGEEDRRLSRLWWAAFLGPAVIVVAAALGTSWQDRPGGVLAFTLGVWALTLMLALPPVVSADRRSTWWLVPPVVMSFASALVAFGVMFGFAALTNGTDSPIGATDTTRQGEVAPTTVNVVADLASVPAPSDPAAPAGAVPPPASGNEPAAPTTTAAPAAPAGAGAPTTVPWPDFGTPAGASTTVPWPDFGPNPGPPITAPWPDFGPNPQPVDPATVPGASPVAPAAG